MLTAQEIRSRFLDYFKRQFHAVEKSGPLVPPNDPSLLFTNAGMVQFKKLFLGEEKRDYKRAATCQKCLRVSGKHNDLENVGRTARHHTFFEMLGNFSFGDYFKREAISWAWDFVVNELKLPREKLWVTVYKDDDEAFRIWQEVANLPEERIVRMNEKDNFWTMGETGPCGPCSEIYIDQGEDMSCGPDCGIGKCDCDRFLEIWNLVFTQFDQQKDGERLALAAPNIDTGMGLERIAAVCQGKRSNFDCDLFQELIQYAAKVANVSYSESAPDTNDIDTALRVIADHARSAAFLVAEGILPSNGQRGYVLRRLIRRALRFATLMGIHEPFLHKVARKVTEVMGDAYPELVKNADFIDRVVYEEERRFAHTLDNGLHMLEEELARLEKAEDKTVSGDFCFLLHDTYGFPLDIVTDVAVKRGFGVDGKGFEKLMEEQRNRARSSQKQGGILGQEDRRQLVETGQALAREGIKSEFIGYKSLKCESVISALINESGNLVETLDEGMRGFVICQTTPFYGESGGQTGDKGLISSPQASARVNGAIKPASDIIALEVQVDAGELRKGDSIQEEVDPDSRLSIARNHTCTHLLHAALRKVLGVHVKQAGSSVDEDRLRFDFSHFSALSKSELSAVEREVNSMIMANLPVQACEMPYDRAIEKGAMALFSEKYGNTVRVLTVGEEASPASVELCGGTHLNFTGQAGSFIITSESAVSAGVRRIEAVSGWNAYNYTINQRGELSDLSSLLKTQPAGLSGRIQILQDEIKKLRKSVEKGESLVSASDLASGVQKVGNINLLMESFPDKPIRALRELMDKLRGQFPTNAIICLAGTEGEKLSLILYVSKDLHSLFKAPELINIVAKICGGSGGGRPDLAQAGGTLPDKLPEGFSGLKQFITEKIK